MLEHNFHTFRIHLREEPQMYAMFRRFALEIASRRERYSARGIIHRMRWETIVSDNSSNYKVNHNWSPFYSRKFMFEFPQYAGFFKLVNQRGSIYEDSVPSDYGVGTYYITEQTMNLIMQREMNQCL